MCTYSLLACSLHEAKPCDLKLLHAAIKGGKVTKAGELGWASVCTVHALPRGCRPCRGSLRCQQQACHARQQLNLLVAAAGLPQWCSVTLHVEPLLCGVAAVGEHLLWDITREGLPLLELLRNKDPRLKQISLLWKELGSCTTDMAYHQMAPMLTSALDKCQLNKTKVRPRVDCAAGARSLVCMCSCMGCAGIPLWQVRADAAQGDAAPGWRCCRRLPGRRAAARRW